MRMASRTTALVLALCTPALGADTRPYANARFGYSIAIPRDFTQATEADNGDGVAAIAQTSDAEFRVWGAYGQTGSFRENALQMIASEESEGWTITYQRVTMNGASWSGTRHGRIGYGRAIPLCENGIGTMRLDYAASQKARYDGIVGQLVKSFRNAECR